MRILYAIQGTGNGHVSRAMDLIPSLRRRANVDILVSGTQVDLQLPFKSQYTLKGLSFIFGKYGGVDMFNTFFKNSTITAYKEIKALPVEKYDLVINDFEPISAWACRLKQIPILALSHQAAVCSINAPQPTHQDWLGSFFLKHYAPVENKLGFHFKSYDDSTFTPIIRKQVRAQKITDAGHYTVYLPAYNDSELIRELSYFPYIKWDIFSKHNIKPINYKNIQIQSINNEGFIRSMASSTGVLCGAGFETPAESLFMGKKLMVIPMKNQFEQHLNAAALETMGVSVMQRLNEKNRHYIQEWINTESKIEVQYPDITEDVVDMIFERGVEKKELRLQPHQFLG